MRFYLTLMAGLLSAAIFTGALMTAGPVVQTAQNGVSAPSDTEPLQAP